MSRGNPRSTLGLFGDRQCLAGEQAPSAIRLLVEIRSPDRLAERTGYVRPRYPRSVPPEDLAFTPETRQPVRIGGERLQQGLQRHVTIERGVAGAQDDAHTAFAERSAGRLRPSVASNFKAMSQGIGTSSSSSWVQLRTTTNCSPSPRRSGSVPSTSIANRPSGATS